MSRRLSQKAIEALNTNTNLYKEVCDAVGVKPISLPKLIQRNSDKLTRYDIVILIASHLGLSPEEILENPEPAAA